MSTKISQLTSATDITASDLIQIVDVEDGVMAPSGTNKKITAQLLADDLAGIVSDDSIATSKLASGVLPSGVTVSSINIVNGTIVDADINASAAIAGSKISPSFTAPSVISVNSSSDALRITQTGTGNALIVEDSANPDSTPFVINQNGVVGIGLTNPNLYIDGAGVVIKSSNSLNPQFHIWNDTDDNNGSFVLYRKDRDGNIVNSGDVISSNVWQGFDGLAFINAASIIAAVDGVPNTNNMPGRITFLTTASGSASLSERMRITSTGNVGIGTSTPNSKLHVAGDLTVSSATTATGATAGTNGDVPAQVEGYLVVNINGTARKIPYYA